MSLLQEKIPSAPTYKPVWKQPRGHYGSNFWEVYSPRLRRNVHLYSDLEYDHWVLIELDPTIKTFCEQPLRISANMEGKVVHSIIDMWIRWKDGREQFREIKYFSELAKESTEKRQLKAQQAWATLHGHDYKIHTEKTIRANPLLIANWKIILRYLASDQKIELLKYQHQIVQLILDQNECSLKELEERFNDWDPIMIRTAIFGLLHLGELVAPLDVQQLNGTLKVRVKDE